ncbi:hypothetical protein EHM92_01975, partial [bacterium]
RFQFDLEPYLDQQLGIGFSLPGEGEAEEANPLTAFLKDQSRRKTIGEEKRILYVACTRARDMLIVSGDWEPDREKVHSLNWILEGLEIGEQPPGGIVERPVELERLSNSGGRPGRRASIHALRVEVIRAEDLSGEEALAALASAGQPFRPQLFIEPLASRSTSEEFSGEMLRKYVECPHRYFARYVLGIPPDAGEERSLKFDATVNALLRQGKLRSLAALFPPARLNVVASTSDPQMLVSVAMPTPEGILSDTLPLVYRDLEGVWSLMRFWTDAGPPGAEEFVQESYRFLLEFDALLLQRLHEVPVVRGALLNAAEPGRSLFLEAGESAAKESEQKVRRIVRSILEKRFGHRALPCPVCHAYDR